MNNSLEKLPFMTWGFIWRLWTNSPPPPFSPTGRQEGEVTNAQMSRGSQGQRPGGGILSKSKRNVYYHWKWTSPLKNCTLWLEASSEQVSEDSEPIVDPFVPPPQHTHTQPGDNRGGHKCANAQQFPGATTRKAAQVSALGSGIKWISSSSPRE